MNPGATKGRVQNKERKYPMSNVRTFRDLIAWQRSMELARTVYEVTTAMPTSERFGLTNQMRRAAVSVPSNIAEGHGRQSRTDYLRFLRTSRGSLGELATQLQLSLDLKMLKGAARAEALLAETDRILQALIRGLERKDSEGK
jgi:four helix bundle protein